MPMSNKEPEQETDEPATAGDVENPVAETPAESENTGANGPAGAGDAVPTESPTEDTGAPAEIGGRGGADPTRFGDWEIGGRCVDF